MWEMVKLGDVCDVLDKLRKPITKKDRISGDYPYYGATGIVDWVHDYIFNEKLVLVGEDGAKWGAGDTTAFIATGKYWVNNHAHVLRPKSELALHEWISYYLTGIDLSDFVTGLTVPKLNQAQLKLIPIPLPPLAEQQRIVAKLDAAFVEIDDTIIYANNKIEELDNLRETTLINVFQSIDELAPEKYLNEVCVEFARGKSKHRPRNDEQLYGDTIPFVQTGDVTNAKKYLNSYSKKYSELGVQQSKVWHEGTVCITIAANIAELAILGMDACFPDSIIGATPDKASTSSEYLYYLLSFYQKKIKAKSKGSAQQNINLGTFSDELFPFPSIKEQMLLIEKLSEFEKHANELDRLESLKIKKLHALKSSILAQELQSKAA